MWVRCPWETGRFAAQVGVSAIDIEDGQSEGKLEMSLQNPRSQGRRLARRTVMQTGSSATEFVLILPAMLFLVFGVIILGLTAFSSLFAAASVPLDARDWAVTGTLGTRTQDFLGVSPSVTIDPAPKSAEDASCVRYVPSASVGP